jgi:hypothetical protein
MEIRCATRDALYPQKLALISPTNGGRSVGIVRLWTKAEEFGVEFSSITYLTVACNNFNKYTIT